MKTLRRNDQAFFRAFDGFQSLEFHFGRFRITVKSHKNQRRIVGTGGDISAMRGNADVSFDHSDGLLPHRIDAGLAELLVIRRSRTTAAHCSYNLPIFENW